MWQKSMLQPLLPCHTAIQKIGEMEHIHWEASELLIRRLYSCMLQRSTVIFL